MAQVTEQDARRVAEAAREAEWSKPSFGKELFLGHLRLDLISPHPRPSEQDRERGEAFLAALQRFLSERVDPLQIERDARIPDDVIEGLKEIGALGMKIPTEYDGLGLTAVYYNRALALAGSWHSSLSTLLSAHQSIGVPEPVKSFGTPEQKKKYLPLVARKEVSAFLLTEPDVGSDPARMHAQAVPIEDGAAYELSGRKLWTTNGVIADRLVVAMADSVPKAWHHLLHRRRARSRRQRGAPQRVHGPAWHRKRRDEVRQGTRTRSRTGSARKVQGLKIALSTLERRAPRAAGDLRRQREVLAADRPSMVQGTRPVGSTDRPARRRRAEDRLHRGDDIRRSRRCSSCPATWQTRAARTSASRRPSPSSTPASWPGSSATS